MSTTIDSSLHRQVIIAAFFFVLGLATVFIALGATATVFGQLLAQYQREMIYMAGAIIILFGLHFLGIIRIPFLYREARLETDNPGGSYAGAYIMGLAFAFGWTPCVGPVLAAILFQAAQADTIWTGVGLLATYAAGLGIPFMLAALFINGFMSFMGEFRRHMGLVEKIMGVMLIVVGLSFITGGFSLLSAWMLDAFPGLADIESSVANEDFDFGNVGYVTAFLAGVVSFLSPCVLPLVPPYLAFLSGTTFDKLTGRA